MVNKAQQRRSRLDLRDTADPSLEGVDGSESEAEDGLLQQPTLLLESASLLQDLVETIRTGWKPMTLAALCTALIAFGVIVYRTDESKAAYSGMPVRFLLLNQHCYALIHLRIVREPKDIRLCNIATAYLAYTTKYVYVYPNC
jgi:hypothetical protein